MKVFRSAFLLFSLLRLQTGHAQNLVPNPSFEDTVACPTGGGQVWKAANWYVAEKTPDYFNECCTHPSFAVPSSSTFGYRYPATGFAFCGFYGYSTIDTFYREKLGVKLSSALKIGTQYFVTLKLTTTAWDNFSGASNKIGVLFSTGKYTPNSPSPTRDYCQFWTDNMITDTVNWVQVWGSFVADSAYTYMTIGNFFTNAHTDTLRYWEPPPQTSYFLQSYYFVDDVCVSEDSAECKTIQVSVNALNEEKEEIKVYPNPASSYLIVQIDTEESSNLGFYTGEGALRLTQNIPRGIHKIKIDVDELNSGIYFLRVILQNKIFSKKIIIHH